MYSQDSQRVAKNTIFLFFRMILVMGVSLFTSRVVLKTLGFEDFGIYNVVGSVVVFFSFLQAALRNATYRYLAFELGTGDKEKLNRIYSMAINSHLLLAVFFFVILEIGGVWFLNHKLNIPDARITAANWTYQFSLMTFCVGVIRTPYESSIIAHERMDFYAIISVFEVLAKLVIVYLLLVIPIDKLIAYSILMTVVYVLLSICYWLYCHIKFSDCRYVHCWDRGILLQFCSYSGWSLLVNGACVIRSQSFNIFFNLFLGVVANAAMGIANQVISAMNSFVTSFTQAFNPQIIKSYASKDYSYFMTMIFSTSKLAYYLLLVLSVPVVFNIDFILKAWLGEFPDMTPTFIETIVLYYLIDAMQSPLVTAVHATGNLKTHQIIISSLVFAVIPLSYLVLKLGLPAYWVLLFNALCNLVCAIARVLYMKRLIDLDLRSYCKKVVVPIGFVTLLALPIPYFMSRFFNGTWTSLLVNTSVSVIASCVLIYYLGLDYGERDLVKRLPVINKLFSKCDAKG